jgi:hypothetical protein
MRFQGTIEIGTENRRFVSIQILFFWILSRLVFMYSSTILVLFPFT